MAGVLNNPSFVYEDNFYVNRTGRGVERTTAARNVSSFKTGVQDSKMNDNKICILHNSTGHNLNECKTFANKPYNVRKMFFRERKLCFKCRLSS